MSITILTESKKLNLPYNQFRLSHAGNIASQLYRDQFGTNPPKIEQVEGNKTFVVSAYPDEYAGLIAIALKEWKPSAPKVKIVSPEPPKAVFDNPPTAITNPYQNLPEVSMKPKRVGKRPRIKRPVNK